MNGIDCCRCGTTITDASTRMQIAVVLMNEHPDGNEVLAGLHLCDRCSNVAEDALSLETTLLAPQ